jgi:hypothetical protein
MFASDTDIPELLAEDNKIRLHSGSACCRSVHNLLFFCLIYKNIKIETYRSIILPAVLYGCVTWSVTLREEHKLRVFENRVPRGIFGGE